MSSRLGSSVLARGREYKEWFRRDVHSCIIVLRLGPVGEGMTEPQAVRRWIDVFWKYSTDRSTSNTNYEPSGCYAVKREAGRRGQLVDICL